jgi:hypothetical protein
MMPRRGSVGLVVLTLMVMLMLMLVAGPAAAQTITVLDCRPRVGFTVGSASNGDLNGVPGGYLVNRGNHSPDFSVSGEVPLADRFSARADVGTTAWTFEDRDAWGVSLVRDRVRVTRATLSLVKQTPTPCGAPVRLYAGAGIGVYRYRFRDQRLATTRNGLHVLLGVEALPRDRVAIALDFSLHAVRGPGREPVHSYLLTVGQASAGIRFLF